ncbi:hypothetical protein MBRA1_003826 [Malassezia brasiliensis]|uniref:U3 small nucleolar RNA-associated protein 14 n=1 Tax=Malassezia brasiliensis TaxID=1821822 RepID=A0AAF0DVL3_9BASI|nr:hypothetical protein MBRA1_003826 [Malassezia brasiliensis]
MARRGTTRRGARARAPAHAEPPARKHHAGRYGDESDEDDEGPRMPRVFDDTDDEPEGIQGEDEEIDSDEAFGESDDEFAMGGRRDGDDREGTPQDFEDDEGDDLVALSNLLDDAPDDDEARPAHAHPTHDSDDSEAYGESGDDDDDLDDDLAELVAQRTKRTADEGAAQPAKRTRTERSEAIPEGPDAASGSAKLRLEDLMSSLGDGARVSSEVRALSAPRSDRGAQPVASKRGGGALHAPLPAVQQDRLDRQAAYALSRDEVQGWAPTIKRLREAEHLSFPLQKPQQPPAPSNAGLTASFAPTTDMERDVAALLEHGGLTEKQLAEQEGLAMKHFSKEEVAARQAELRRMRELMFRMEQKARRANKIKSKSYRRVHRRERERLQAQLAAAQEDAASDAEGDTDAAQRAAAARAKERATLRHRNTGKWAKSHLGRHDDASHEARLAIEEQLQRGEALRQRIHVHDSDASDDDSDLSGDDAFDELADVAARERARDAATEAAMEAAGKPGKNVYTMKFMKDARERQNKATEAAIAEMHDALAHSDASDAEDPAAVQRVGRGGRAVYGTGAIASDRVPTRPAAPATDDAANPWLADEASGARSRATNQVLVGKDSSAATRAKHRQARHVARGAEARDAAADDAALAIDPDAHLARAADDAPSTSEASGDEMVEVPSKHARGKRGRGKRASTLLPMQQRDLVSEAFAGDDVTLDFAREKRRAVRAEAPRDESTELPGWGAWGGKGVRRKPKKPEHVRHVPGLDPAQRKDRAMDNVIINERLDKKAAKFKAKDLPYPYTSAAQYEAAMRQPIGSEWNTRTQHQRLTLPRVTTKMGQRIDPIQRKF